MRRILISIFCSIFASICLTNVISAEEIVCEYDDVGLTMTWDTEKAFNVGSNPYVKMLGFESSDDYEREWLLWRSGKKVSLTEHAEIDQKLYKEILDNYGCNDGMKVCIYTEVASDSLLGLPTDLLDALFAWDWDKVDLGGQKQSLVIMTDAEYRESDYALWDPGDIYVFGHDQVYARWSDGYNFGDLTGSLLDYLGGVLGVGSEHHTYVYKETSCETVKYNGPYIGVNINCSLLQNKLLRHIKAIANYKDCGDNISCKRRAKTKVKEQEDNVKAQCKSIFENYNYSGGEAECIDACLDIRETLNKHKEGTDLYEDLSGSGKDTCGFSQRLGTWILNIFRWIKYILPVLVIILGILDFIKAISSNKEDEMKKAQKNFIIRLISAALVFIIPLIIEFIIVKMGFTYEGCGLF